MDRLADSLQRLSEDDLLQVVQMVHEHKSSDSYTKNDVDGKSQSGQHLDACYRILNYLAIPAGEFHVDLYTLPDGLIRMLWDFSQEKLP